MPALARGHYRRSRHTITDSVAEIMQAMPLAHTGTITPSMETGHAWRKRTPCNNATSAKTTEAIAEKGFIGLPSLFGGYLKTQHGMYRLHQAKHDLQTGIHFFHGNAGQ